VKILKERRERDLFLINSAVSSTKRTPDRERERERERKRKIQKRDTSKKHLFKKKTRSFLHTPGSLLLARAHERVNIT
jgi:hypothetical protein